MSEKSSHTAATDVEYNIVTTLSNLLQAQDVLQRYAQDAQQAGDKDLESLFNELNQSNNDFAKRFREQLHKLMH